LGAPLSDATTPDLAATLSLSGPQASSAQAAQIAPDAAVLNPNLALALDAPDAVADPATSVQSAVPAPAAPLAQTNTAALVAPAAQPKVDFSRLPLAFVENRGQTNPRVRYLVHGAGGTLFFTPDEAVLTLPDPADTITTTVVRLRYEGTNPNPTLSARNRLPGVVNYFRGSNPAQWRTDVPTYAGISYDSLYAGITLHYDGTNGQLKSTYVVAPGADPAQIRWRYLGARDMQVDAATGDLQIRLPAPGAGRAARILSERAPLAWQDIGAQRVPVTVRFDLAANGTVGFALGSYDQTQPLTIDPILNYATYHGGNRDDTANAIAVDSSGNVYVAGYTTSNTNFPLQNALDSSYNNNTDAFVSKLNADGSALLWSSYIGGGEQDKANAIALDSSNNVYLAGQTRSSGSTAYPTTSSALDTTYGGGSCSGDPCKDVVFTKLSAAGSSILYSTYMGGNGDDEASGIAVSGGIAYLTGFSAGGLPTKSAYRSSYQGGVADVFVSKIDPTQSQDNSNIYTTYLGGSADDKGAAVAVDAAGVASITGYTDSTNFTITSASARQTSNGGQADVFLAQLGAAGNSLSYGSYLGGSSIDRGTGIALDSSGNAYLTGYSGSSSFPTLNPWQASHAGDKDAIVVKFNPAASGAASLVYSTFIGGTAEDTGMAIALDSSNNVYLTGETQSDSFPTQHPLQASRDASGSCTTPSAHPCSDAFVTEFSIANNSPVYSSYLGGSLDDEGHGIAVDSSGAVYVTGYANGNFPTASPRQAASGGQRDAFIAKLTLPSATLGASTASIAQSAGAINLTVTLSVAPTYTTTVGYATSNGTATAGSDYSASSGTLTFAPGITSQVISVPIIDDDTDEPNETFTVTLNSPSNAIVGTPNSTTVTITDDDSAPTVSWQAGNFNAGEASGSGLVTVLLSAASSFTVTVNYASSDGSATLTPPPPDYTAASGTLTFAPGVTSQSTSITILDDSAGESSETINLTLSSPSNATLGTPNPATLTIIDDETPPPPGEEFYTYLDNVRFDKRSTRWYTYSH
jgi:hypothetical protein